VEGAARTCFACFRPHPLTCSLSAPSRPIPAGPTRMPRLRTTTGGRSTTSDTQVSSGACMQHSDSVLLWQRTHARTHACMYQCARSRTRAFAHAHVPLTREMPAFYARCRACTEPTNCKVSTWEPYSKCTKSCAGGHKHRFRHISVHPYGGVPVPWHAM
jgi:hypothetical protein